jgi:endonuclease/exonuclease/phosphatase (EEP) superfamily protein YafD
MLMFQIVVYAVGALAIILTVLPFLKFAHWWIRLGDFPRLQIAFGSLVVAGLLPLVARPAGLWEIVFGAALVGCAVYQIFCVLPYTRVYPRQVERARENAPEKTIKLLIFNVFIENRDYAKFLDLVGQVAPDLILLAEPDEKWLSSIEALEKNYPFAVKHPLDNAYGLALYSRLELKNADIKFIIENDIPSIHTDVRLASGDLIKFYCLHPRPPIPPENDRALERDAELILVGAMIQKTDAPTIVAGDLNDVAWSRTTRLFQKISNLLDPRIGRGLYSSFHAAYPFIRFPLDHVFHSNHFRLVEIRRLPNIGSDHFPIYIALSYERTAKLTQEEPEATTGEIREALEIVEEAFETFAEEGKFDAADRRSAD